MLLLRAPFKGFLHPKPQTISPKINPAKGSFKGARLSRFLDGPPQRGPFKIVFKVSIRCLWVWVQGFRVLFKELGLTNLGVSGLGVSGFRVLGV